MHSNSVKADRLEKFDLRNLKNFMERLNKKYLIHILCPQFHMYFFSHLLGINCFNEQSFIITS